ncbi:tetratricopeptide repeat protein [Glycomyces sp. L485]|uniref:co-chaperone YbbN n=1 Tax=Glycomyces sp. L485 TaxID=2909235 RepID=UPI001F4B2AA0|nr:tetratricopeptide repeat protein [Glycomyces sp. L485]MCH7231932.1 tetratricopeptide repeat protein [Glycomyces sp. L485]
MSDNVPSRFSGSAVDLSALAAQQQQQQNAAAQQAGGQTPPAAPAGAGAPGVVALDVTDATVQTEVLERSLNTLVVVVFWADQAPESVQTRDLLQRLAHADGGSWTLAKADVQYNQQLAAALQLQSLPAVVAVAGGRPVDLVQGPQTEQGLRQWIAKLAQAAGVDVPQQIDPELAAAEDHMVEGNLDAAEIAFDKYLKNNPGSLEAESGLAQVRMLRRAGALPQDAVGIADADPDDIDAALAAADLQMLSGQADEAYDRLIKQVAKLAGDDRERVRKRLVELFSIAGPDDPNVTKARRKLSSVLF